MDENSGDLEPVVIVKGKLQSVSMFICRYFVTCVFFLIGVANGSSIHQFIVGLLAGVIVDVMRQIIAPEFKLSAEQRRESFLRAIADESIAKKGRTDYRIRAMWIYWIWWAYLFLFLTVPDLRTPSFLTKSLPAEFLVKICSQFYPVTRFYFSPLSYPVDSGQIYSTIQFLSVSWWLMILSIILEASGGTFYRTHDELRIRYKAKVSGMNVFDRSQFRFPSLFPFSAVLYFTPMIVTIFQGLPPIQTSNSNGGFEVTLYAAGFSVIGVAFAFRLAYQILLQNVSGMTNFIDKVGKEKLV